MSKIDYMMPHKIRLEKATPNYQPGIGMIISPSKTLKQ